MGKLIESWLDPKKYVLKSTINTGNTKYIEAFEVWVNGKLIHSEQQCNHGYLDTHHDEEHMAAVKQEVEDILAGKNPELPDKREDSQIKAEKLKKQQQNEERDRKKKEAEDAVKRKKQ